ncbi:kinesin-like protein Klp61F isoform X2 [Bactrocera dorsalis]|uniref:Kinesin-like protein Klp61F isoform X1 n=3 Tax=Bactrocera dorsalis TaxID=27457 RepID=A0A6I9UVC7_BACDO|nr:kinesin-like protein Klp61F isoform X1 [Bactrocera dorsalis]XP_049314479.1 kinesin-like protein Klp61F isoform X2 [Bactrocera dorsalis]
MAMNTSSGATNNASNQQPRKISNQNIQVYVRVRPLNARERCIRSAEVIETVSHREIVARHTIESKLTKKFTFDRVFGTDSRQADVYSTVVAPLIEEVLSGYNCTVFAYGQTGTGKTHTMVGTECAELKSSWEDDSDIGIIPRALSHLFDELRMLEMEFSMRISYLELYNEELCDLLSSDDSVKIRIFDDSTKKGSVIIQGLEEIPVHSKDDVYKLLEKGKERRKTATTLMNAQSSRSHTVFSILVHIRENGIDGEEMLKIGKLNLVDLAGSENVSKAGNEKGIRARETVNINQSLLTLGRVITALVERTPHIPYRESKLTRLLQESLGGRTKTSIIATISPGHKDIEETLSTLEYAHRAKNIQNKPEVNQKLTKKTVLKEYTEEIDKLKRDLIAARDKNGIYLAEDTYNEMTLKMDSQNRELNEKMLLLKALKDELQNKERIFTEVSLNLVEKTEELKRAEQNLNQTQGALQQTKRILNSTKRRYKEKKVLLQSHMKTEEVLTHQALEILDVADIATKDTHQLHSTIERRKDVDVKIQTACERFAERMHDNFELMDSSLSTLKEKQDSCTKMLLEEFANTSNAHKKLINDSGMKIQKVNDLCKESLASTCTIIEKCAQALGDASSEQKIKLTNLFKELESKQIEMIAQMQEKLQDLVRYTEQQKANTEKMCKTVVESLQEKSQNLQVHTKKLTERIAESKQISETSIQHLALMHVEIENERTAAAEERAIMEEIIEKLNTLKEKSYTSRKTRADAINTLTVKLEDNTQSTIERLQQSSTFAQAHCEESCNENVAAQQEFEKQTVEARKCNEQQSNAESTLKEQLCSMQQDDCVRIVEFTTTAATHLECTQKSLGAYVDEVKHARVENESKLDEATNDVKASLTEDAQRFKQHVAVTSGLINASQQNILNYANTYKEQMGTCVSDVDKFKQSELKTYAPTGTTPSKRNFVYPRSLASTSPHIDIVKRFRQENEWSDLDTTAPIDEGSEDEHELKNSVQEISQAEMLLNSTPIDLTNVVTPQPNNAANKKLNAILSKKQLRNSNSLSSGSSPRKPSPAHNSSAPTSRANKENLS